jgi:hypothetical protein
VRVVYKFLDAVVQCAKRHANSFLGAVLITRRPYLNVGANKEIAQTVGSIGDFSI